MWGTNIFLKHSKQLGVTYFCFLTIIGKLCICNYLLFKTIGTNIYTSHIVSLVLNMVSNMWVPNGLSPMLSKWRNCGQLCGPHISELVTCVIVAISKKGEKGWSNIQITWLWQNPWNKAEQGGTRPKKGKKGWTRAKKGEKGWTIFPARWNKGGTRVEQGGNKGGTQGWIWLWQYPWNKAEQGRTRLKKGKKGWTIL